MKKLVLVVAAVALIGCPGAGTNKTEPGVSKKQAGPAKPRTGEAKPAPAAKKETVVKSVKAEVVTIVGTAHRAKLGPMVQSEKYVVYCMNLPEWPDHVLGKKVKITGTLTTTDQFKARTTKSGAISQGTRGGDTVMNDARWELVK